MKYLNKDRNPLSSGTRLPNSFMYIIHISTVQWTSCKTFRYFLSKVWHKRRIIVPQSWQKKFLKSWSLSHDTPNSDAFATTLPETLPCMHVSDAVTIRHQHNISFAHSIASRVMRIELKRKTWPVQSVSKATLQPWLHGWSISFQFGHVYLWCNGLS